MDIKVKIKATNLNKVCLKFEEQMKSSEADSEVLSEMFF